MKDFFLPRAKAVGHTIGAQFVYTLFRVFIGYNIAFNHGLSKVKDSSGLAGWLKSMEWPMPEVLAYLAAYGEFLGGILIMAGLFSRIGGLLVTITMAVVVFLIDLPAGKAFFITDELAQMYFWAAAAITAIGPGKISVDALRS